MMSDDAVSNKEDIALSDKKEEVALDDSSDEMQEFRQDLSLLLEAGFVAVKQLDEISASRLFLAAQAIAPDSTAPKIGLGYIALNKLELKESTKIFREVVDQDPSNYLAQVFLGISLSLANPDKKEGETMINQALAKTEDPEIKKLGEVSLQWIKKDIRKKDRPFAVPASE